MKISAFPENILSLNNLSLIFKNYLCNGIKHDSVELLIADINENKNIENEISKSYPKKI